GTHGTDRLEVLVNLTWLVPGVVGGSEESTTDALRAVLEHHPEVALTLAVLEPFAAAHPDLAEACRCEVLRQDGSVKARRVLSEQSWLARRTRALHPDVVHHAGGVVPLVHPGRVVLTIHDLQPVDLPANFATTKRSYARAMLGRSARVAEVICVPSEFTSERAQVLLGVAPERIRVVPWATPLPGAPGGPAEKRWEVGEPPVFLYPAITYPHKNHLELLEAFAGVLSRIPDARLLMPGGPGPLEHDVSARAARPDLAGHVTRPGRVANHTLESMYASATAVVVPSTYEGFGLPALEAMARGVPVVVADAGSLPEVVGHAGIAPVAGGSGRWADAMVQVASLDAAGRGELVAAQLEQAARFGSRRTADALVGAYRAAAGSPRV
ncbi:MAG: glycosyltransferase family 4 protein, partial [Microthrixaceae bacterium]